MRNLYGFIAGMFLLATIVSIFGQGIAYFLNENILSISPVYYLTGLTVLGILLFLGAGLGGVRLFKKQETTCRGFEPYFVLLSIVAVSVSSWSIFVMVMWWG